MTGVRALAQPYLQALARAGFGADRAYSVLRDILGPGYSRDDVRADIQMYRSAEQKAQFASFIPARFFIGDSSHEIFAGIQERRYRYMFAFTRTDASGSPMKPLFVQVATSQHMTRGQVSDIAREYTLQSPQIGEVLSGDMQMVAAWLNPGIDAEF